MPVKTLLIFVHNKEFSLDFTEKHAIVDFAVENCTTRDDIQKLILEGRLPPVLQGLPSRTEDTSTLASAGAEVIIFDTRAQAGTNARLLAWVNFHRHYKYRH